MTDQPTDHRASAEHWRLRAITTIAEGAEGFAQAEALVGILDALLALTASPPRIPFATSKSDLGDGYEGLPPGQDDEHDHDWIDITTVGQLPGSDRVCRICDARITERVPAYDIRCTANNLNGQCLDHRGHTGDHQYPPVEVVDAVIRCGHIHTRGDGTKSECDLPDGHHGVHYLRPQGAYWQPQQHGQVHPPLSPSEG